MNLFPRKEQKEKEFVFEDNVTIVTLQCRNCAHPIKVPVYLPPDVVKAAEEENKDNLKSFVDYYLKHVLSINMVGDDH